MQLLFCFPFLNVCCLFIGIREISFLEKCMFPATLKLEKNTWSRKDSVSCKTNQPNKNISNKKPKHQSTSTPSFLGICSLHWIQFAHFNGSHGSDWGIVLMTNLFNYTSFGTISSLLFGQVSFHNASVKSSVVLSLCYREMMNSSL